MSNEGMKKAALSDPFQVLCKGNLPNGRKIGEKKDQKSVGYNNPTCSVKPNPKTYAPPKQVFRDTESDGYRLLPVFNSLNEAQKEALRALLFNNHIYSLKKGFAEGFNSGYALAEKRCKK